MIYPIILCGGQGRRLWPSSRESYPKQFAPLLRDRSPFQDLLEILSGPGFGRPLVCTREEYQFMAEDQAQSLGLWDADILVEPKECDTAASVLAAVLKAGEAPDDLFLVTPILHVGGSIATFRDSLLAASEQALAGSVVRFRSAVAQSRAHIEASGQAAAGVALVEKIGKQAPDNDDPAEFRGGPILLRGRDLVLAFKTSAPDMLDACHRTVADGKADLGHFRYGKEAFAEAPAGEFETFVTEQCQNRVEVPLDNALYDLGSWESVWSLMPRDQSGVAASGEVLAINCRDSLLRSDDPSMQMLAIGLENVVAVAMRDAVLVADRSAIDQIPAALDRLKLQRKIHANEYPRYHRPWGWYESLIVSDRFQVKRIMVKPTGVLSLQSHVHRSEHWIVVSGTAEVTVNEQVTLVPENGSVYIPLGAVHRMANPGKVPMYLIEVQTGTYLGEDDIKRYEDVYDRC